MQAQPAPMQPVTPVANPVLFDTKGAPYRQLTDGCREYLDASYSQVLAKYCQTGNTWQRIFN